MESKESLTATTEAIREILNQARANPRPLAEEIRLLREQGFSLKGLALFDTSEQLRLAYDLIRDEFSLTDADIEHDVTHEEEHIAEAKKIYKDKAIYGYGIQFILRDDGKLGITPAYVVAVLEEIDQETFRQHGKRIAGAPSKPSMGDKLTLQG